MSSSTEIEIAGRPIGAGHPPYVIAELSGNHNGRLDRAIDLVRAAASAGADAVKIQTYTADTITIDSTEPWFRIGDGTLWSGRNLHDLYEEAATPWEWHAPLRDEAEGLGLAFFSTPFDHTAVDHLEAQGVPAYKVASFEIVDLELVARIGATGKPVIISTGMATAAEIDAAVRTAREAGAGGVALLRCNSSYPAPAEEMDLATIADMRARWDVPVGLSDHTLSSAAAIAAVALGASIVEKHVTWSRAEPGPDSAFSLEPDELAALVADVHAAAAAVGAVRYGPSPSEEPSVAFRRSLFVVADLAPGDELTRDNVRSIRPGNGLPPSALVDVLGRRVRVAVRRGTPLSHDLVDP